MAKPRKVDNKAVCGVSIYDDENEERKWYKKEYRNVYRNEDEEEEWEEKYGVTIELTYETTIIPMEVDGDDDYDMYSPCKIDVKEEESYGYFGPEDDSDSSYHPGDTESDLTDDDVDEDDDANYAVSYNRNGVGNLHRPLPVPYCGGAPSNKKSYGKYGRY